MVQRTITERRLSARLEDYWGRLRGENTLPMIEQFNREAIADVWDFCFQVSALKNTVGKTAYKYEYVGKEVVNILGKNLSGQMINPNIKAEAGSIVLKHLHECVDTLAPKHLEGKFVNEHDRIVKFRSCAIPFGKEKRVTHIIVGLSWKVFR